MRILILLQLFIFISCQQIERDSLSETHKDTVELNSIVNTEENQLIENTEQQEDYSDEARDPDFCDTLSAYFSKSEIHPLINKSYSNGSDTVKTFKIGSHIINWNFNDSTTLAKIDAHIIKIDNVKSFSVEDNSEVNIAGSYFLSGVKLYSIYGREIIIIEFGLNGCGGRCFNNYSLFYDVKNKTTNYYLGAELGCFSLYDFKHNGKIDILYPTFDGDIDGIEPYSHKYTLLELDSKGRFQFQKDKFGTNYFIMVTYAERSPEVGCEKAELNWYEPLK